MPALLLSHKGLVELQVHTLHVAMPSAQAVALHVLPFAVAAAAAVAAPNSQHVAEGGMGPGKHGQRQQEWSFCRKARGRCRKLAGLRRPWIPCKIVVGALATHCSWCKQD